MSWRGAMKSPGSTGDYYGIEKAIAAGIEPVMDELGTLEKRLAAQQKRIDQLQLALAALEKRLDALQLEQLA